MPTNLDMLVWMKLSNQAAVEVTLARGQGILSLDSFSEMYKDGVELEFCQLARPGGVDAGIKISTDGQQRFGLMMDAIKQWEQGHREVDNSSLGYVVREALSSSQSQLLMLMSTGV
jgi:hypothetical protein